VTNQVAPPFRVAEFDVMNVGGISKSGGILDVGVELGVIEKSGAFFRYKGKLLAQGREGVKIVLNENEKLSHELEAEIWKIARESKSLPKEMGEKEEE